MRSNTSITAANSGDGTSSNVANLLKASLMFDNCLWLRPVRLNSHTPTHVVQPKRTPRLIGIDLKRHCLRHVIQKLALAPRADVQKVKTGTQNVLLNTTPDRVLTRQKLIDRAVRMTVTTLHDVDVVTRRNTKSQHDLFERSFNRERHFHFERIARTHQRSSVT